MLEWQVYVRCSWTISNTGIVPWDYGRVFREISCLFTKIYTLPRRLTIFRKTSRKSWRNYTSKTTHMTLQRISVVVTFSFLNPTLKMYFYAKRYVYSSTCFAILEMTVKHPRSQGLYILHILRVARWSFPFIRSNFRFKHNNWFPTHKLFFPFRQKKMYDTDRLCT